LDKRAGEKDERIHAVAAWRHAPYFTEAERAALELTEAVTRFSDREDPVPDSVRKEAAKYYDESALAALILAIAQTNVWNRLNVAAGLVAGEWNHPLEALLGIGDVIDFFSSDVPADQLPLYAPGAVAIAAQIFAVRGRVWRNDDIRR